MRLSLSIPMLAATVLTCGLAMAERPAPTSHTSIDKPRPERVVAKPDRINRPAQVEKDDMKRSHGDIVDSDKGASKAASRASTLSNAGNVTKVVTTPVTQIKVLKDAPNACRPGSENCGSSRTQHSPGATLQAKSEKNEKHDKTTESASDHVRKEKIMALVKAAMCSRGACADER